MICPSCGSYNDPAISPSGRLPPQDWQPIMCVGCDTILVIDHTIRGGLRLPTDADWEAWHHDRRIAAALRIALNARRQT